MTQENPNIVHLDSSPVRVVEKGSAFSFKMKRLGKATGSKGIGCSWMEVPPGKSAFPFHFHSANEEAMFILEGQGSLRIGDKTVTVKKGDYITFPVGQEYAHRLTVTGDKPMQYLSLSTLVATEVVGYPDSGKIGAVVWPSDSDQPKLRGIFRQESSVDYYEGEKVD